MGLFRRKLNKNHRSAMKKAQGERVVRTPEGARRYGVPIGTPISAAKAKSKAAKPIANATTLKGKSDPEQRRGARQERTPKADPVGKAATDLIADARKRAASGDTRDRSDLRAERQREENRKARALTNRLAAAASTESRKRPTPPTSPTASGFDPYEDAPTKRASALKRGDLVALKGVEYKVLSVTGSPGREGVELELETGAGGVKRILVQRTRKITLA